MDKRKCLNIKVINDNNGLVVGKWCNSCFEYLDVESFDWNVEKGWYLLGWCKECNVKNVSNKI